MIYMELEKPKLKISPKKYTGETSVISMRLPKDMIKDLDNTAEMTGNIYVHLGAHCLGLVFTVE